MLAAVIPPLAAGHTLPVLLPDMEAADKMAEVYLCLLANFNSFIFDYTARQKMQSPHLTLYILEQLPVIPPARYAEALGTGTVGDFVRKNALALTYTAQDLEPFARALGYEGPPFGWDEEDRRHRRARLDALYFMLYGLTDDEVTHVLEAFPIVRQKDEAQFGRYRTLDLILGYLRALRAGDTETTVRG